MSLAAGCRWSFSLQPLCISQISSLLSVSISSIDNINGMDNSKLVGVLSAQWWPRQRRLIRLQQVCVASTYLNISKRPALYSQMKPTGQDYQHSDAFDTIYWDECWRELRTYDFRHMSKWKCISKSFVHARGDFDTEAIHDYRVPNF